jgi:hypothetical protein
MLSMRSVSLERVHTIKVSRRSVQRSQTMRPIGSSSRKGVHTIKVSRRSDQRSQMTQPVESSSRKGGRVTKRPRHSENQSLESYVRSFSLFFGRCVINTIFWIIFF